MIGLNETMGKEYCCTGKQVFVRENGNDFPKIDCQGGGGGGGGGDKSKIRAHSQAI